MIYVSKAVIHCQTFRLPAGILPSDFGPEPGLEKIPQYQNTHVQVSGTYQKLMQRLHVKRIKNNQSFDHKNTKNISTSPLFPGKSMVRPHFSQVPLPNSPFFPVQSPIFPIFPGEISRENRVKYRPSPVFTGEPRPPAASGRPPPAPRWCWRLGRCCPRRRPCWTPWWPSWGRGTTGPWGLVILIGSSPCLVWVMKWVLS